MSALSFSSFYRPSAATVDRAKAGFTHGLRTLGDTYWTWYQRIHQRHLLSGMSDHLIKDLGISRADIAHETSKPFWRP